MTGREILGKAGWKGRDGGEDNCKAMASEISEMIPDVDSTFDLLEFNLQNTVRHLKMVIQPDPMIAIFGIVEENNNNLSGTKFKITKFVPGLSG